jgi:hypothetical protein
VGWLATQAQPLGELAAAETLIPPEVQAQVAAVVVELRTFGAMAGLAGMVWGQHHKAQPVEAVAVAQTTPVSTLVVTAYQEVVQQ